MINPKQQISIFCENTQTKHSYPFGTTLQDVVDDLMPNTEFPILGAMVNNKLKELDYLLYKPKNIRFIDYTHQDGRRMYLRSLSMVLFKAVHDVFPKAKLSIQHSISNGLYCELEDVEKNDSHTINKIRKRMQEIIDLNLPFERNEIPTQEALKEFEKFNLTDKCLLMQTRQQYYSSVYRLDNVINYFYGYLVPSTSHLHAFDLQKYYEGMLLILPKKTNPHELEEVTPQNKLFEIFKEFKDWVDIIEIPNVGKLNLAVQNKTISNIIKISEALQEKKLAYIADMIHQRGNVKVVFISGPSSSGKTTFAKRLSVQLSVIGFKPIVLSMDNYFVNREKTPRDENGDYDFESPYALDIQFFNENLLSLFEGKEIDLPKFSFSEGKRYFDGTKLKMQKNSILVIEGIHGLNPLISKLIDKELKFKIYVSALTPLNFDSNNRIPSSDNRLIRRMVRDHSYRGYSALETLQRWPSVRRGEKKHIFPYQNEADVMFNTALLFELGILKRWAEPLLQEVPPIVPEYSEARRLLKFFTYILPINEKEIPPTSILREFLDGSSFKY